MESQFREIVRQRIVDALAVRRVSLMSQQRRTSGVLNLEPRTVVCLTRHAFLASLAPHAVVSYARPHLLRCGK